VTRLSDFLDREIEHGSFPGGVAMAGSSEEILEVAFAGHRAVEPREEPTTPDTLYDLASLTKPLAAGALAVASPGLALGAPPGRYFPQWKRTRYDGITIEMLMTHTSGLPAWYPLYARGEGVTAYRRALCEIEPEARPGERVIYSDLNFLLLGEILESLYSAPLDRCFADLVARPADSGARFLPESPGETAATEKGDVTERAMTAALGLSYARFRTDVVRGEVHDGNAFRRWGRGQCRSVRKCARRLGSRASLAARLPPGCLRRPHSGLARGARPRLAGGARSGVGRRGNVEARVRPHGFYRHVCLDRSRRAANLDPSDQQSSPRRARRQLQRSASSVPRGGAGRVSDLTVGFGYRPERTSSARRENPGLYCLGSIARSLRQEKASRNRSRAVRMSPDW
jgi:CubicO group peptidase (beta-lactamase class C family)